MILRVCDPQSVLVYVEKRSRSCLPQHAEAIFNSIGVPNRRPLQRLLTETFVSVCRKVPVAYNKSDILCTACNANVEPIVAEENNWLADFDIDDIGQCERGTFVANRTIPSVFSPPFDEYEASFRKRLCFKTGIAQFWHIARANSSGMRRFVRLFYSSEMPFSQSLDWLEISKAIALSMRASAKFHVQQFHFVVEKRCVSFLRFVDRHFSDARGLHTTPRLTNPPRLDSTELLPFRDGLTRTGLSTEVLELRFFSYCSMTRKLLVFERAGWQYRVKPPTSVSKRW